MFLHMFVYNQNPWNLETPVFCKAVGFPAPTVPEMYRVHLIIWTLVYHFRKIVRHIRWIQRPGIILTLLLIVVTFLNLSWQWKNPKCGLAVLISPSTHYHAHWKYTGSPWNTDTSTLRTHCVGPNGVRFRGAPLYISIVQETGNIDRALSKYSVHPFTFYIPINPPPLSHPFIHHSTECP